MKGLELSKKYYLEYGAPMLEKEFPELVGVIAAGLVGSGSECYGYDDEISRDHDFEPGFCLFIPGEDIIDSRTEFALERAYAKLPDEFMGYKRSKMNPVGGNRHGVMRIADFYIEKAGTPDGNLSTDAWFALPEYALCEATNGGVYRDDFGLFTSIRSKLLDMPRDVRLKKLAGNLLLMGQSGQYNYERCISRGETGAAQLALFEFAKSAMQTVFLLNEKHMPYYKWSFRAMRELPKLSEIADKLEYLISTDNASSKHKITVIEEISESIVGELKSQTITKTDGKSLEEQAYLVNGNITDGNIRNKHILFAV